MLVGLYLLTCAIGYFTIKKMILGHCPNERWTVYDRRMTLAASLFWPITIPLCFLALSDSDKSAKW